VPDQPIHLTADERHALKEVAKGAMGDFPAPAMANRLIFIGLIEETATGYRLTRDGHGQVRS
jgi:CHASE2 domain-containing sensor protein